MDNNILNNPKWKIDEADYLPLAIIEDTEDGEGIIEIGERTEANLKIAERICKAVNNYDSLLEALKEAKYELMNSISNTCKTEKEAIIKLKENSTYQKVKAAIQKAEQ